MAHKIDPTGEGPRRATHKTKDAKVTKAEALRRQAMLRELKDRVATGGVAAVEEMMAEEMEEDHAQMEEDHAQVEDDAPQMAGGLDDPFG